MIELIMCKNNNCRRNSSCKRYQYYKQMLENKNDTRYIPIREQNKYGYCDYYVRKEDDNECRKCEFKTKSTN